MTQEQQQAEAQAVVEPRKMTPQEQIDSMLPALHKLLPQIIEVAKLYHANYPADKTDPAVIDAVTVVLPLRHFMISAAILTNLAVIDRVKQAAAPKAAA